MFKDLVAGTRSTRRFRQDVPIGQEALSELVDLARLAPSSRNMQPLKFLLSNQPERNAIIFAALAWAGYMPDWDGPVEGERPAAYIVMLGDTGLSKNFDIDSGLAAQTILLGARERGLAGCILGSVKRDELQSALAIPAAYRILLVIALGAPGETVVVEPMGPDGDVRYWRDAAGVHHVPKRSLADLIV